MFWYRSLFVRGAGVVWPLVLTASALTNAGAASPALAPDAVHFKLHGDYLVVLPVMVNGAGPYSFLLDTGAAATVIDPDLQRQLDAPPAGKSTVAWLSGVQHDQCVRLNKVQLGPAAVAGLEVLVDTMGDVKKLLPGIRGVLGEDFLKYFDVLIDYQKRSLYFGEMTPDGPQYSFEKAGAYHGIPTHNRLLLKVGFPDAGKEDVVLQLDTAAWVTELFPASDIVLPSASESSSTRANAMAVQTANEAAFYRQATLRIGPTELRGLSVAESRENVMSDAVGLLPTAIFRRVYISHSGGFVILNPVMRRQPLHEKSIEVIAAGAAN